MEIRSGCPFHGTYLEELRSFLKASGLKYDERVQFSVCLVEDEKIAASGSLDGNVLKCIAVSPDFQEGGLAARIVTALIEEAYRNGAFHLFIFTKPENEFLFGNLGFYKVAKTEDALLMENKKNGIASFVDAIEKPDPLKADGPLKTTGPMLLKESGDLTPLIGGIVMNCNPFTLGHQYLIETAAKQCAFLYIFVVSENKSAFPAEDRYRLVCAGTAHLSNVLVTRTGPYLVSAATFPDYFFKDTVSPENINTLLDLTIFAECFAKPLGIKRRFVGTEPLDPVTLEYNKQMKEYLPLKGIELVEISRIEKEGAPVSAGRVRKLLTEGKMDELRELVPEATFKYLVRSE